MAFRLVLALSIAAGLVGCSRSESGDGVEVVHNLTSPSQQQGARVLRNAFEARGGAWVDSPIAGGATARAAMINRALAGDPAPVMFTPSRLGLAELTSKGFTTAVAPSGWKGWKTSVPGPIWEEMINSKGEVILTPIVIGVFNVTIFNDSVLKKAGAAAPTTWDELFPVLDKIKASGQVVPLAFSETPAQMFQTLENIVAGQGGRELYTRIFINLDPTAFSTPEFKRVAETLRRLKPYTDPGSASRSWQDAAEMVASGRAGVQTGGTFVQASYMLAGKKAGVDYHCANLGGVAIVAPNAFMYGRSSSEAVRKQQDLFASVVMDPKVEIEFASKFGGLPPRLDADISSLDSCVQGLAPAVRNPATSVKEGYLVTPPNVIGAITDAVQEYWTDDRMGVDAFVGKLQAAVRQG